MASEKVPWAAPAGLLGAAASVAALNEVDAGTPGRRGIWSPELAWVAPQDEVAGERVLPFEPAWPVVPGLVEAAEVLGGVLQVLPAAETQKLASAAARLLAHRDNLKDARNE